MPSVKPVATAPATPKQQQPSVFGRGSSTSVTAWSSSNSDITVLGSVGSGAEIVAGGSIHIYGTLRGRAMAGAHGQRAGSHLFHHVEALLAINSFYKPAEALDESFRRGPAQAWLEGETLKISALN